MKFEVKVQFPEQQGDKIKTVKEVYLIEADLFGEAEAIAYEHATSAAEVIGIKISAIENVLGHDLEYEGKCPFFYFENKDEVELKMVRPLSEQLRL